MILTPRQGVKISRNVLLLLLAWWGGFSRSGCLRAQNPGNVIERDSVVKTDTSQLVDLIDIGKKLFRIPSPPAASRERKMIYFSALPFSNQVPGGGAALVTSATALFYMGDRKDTYVSRAVFAPYWNFGRRFGLPIRSFVWLKKNRWVVNGDTRLMIYPQHTWGLGRQYPEHEKLLVNYSYFRFYQQVLKRLYKGFLAGPGFHIDYRRNIHTRAGDPLLRDFTGYDYGTAQHLHGYSSGLSMNLLYDTRSYLANEWYGYFVSLQYRINPTFLGNDNLWHSVYLDFRRYIRLDPVRHRQNTLAVWTYYWKAFNDKVPYLDLPSIGWEDYNRSGRGFEQNRYRGNDLFYLEAEYRRDVTDNGLLGFVVFANANTVDGPGSRFMVNWNPGGGIGVRVKLSKKTGTNIALNYGFSKNYQGIKLTLGEVF